MMTKVFTWRSQLCIMHYALSIICIVLLSGLSMSCSDDDDDKDGRTPEEIAQDPYEKESEAGDALYRLACQLSVCDSLPNDWKTTTFEPSIGHVLDPSQPRVRTLTVKSAAEAVTRYNSLTGKNLPATTMSDSYEVEGVGKLTLTVGGSGTIATIDFDVKQMPNLQQLRMVDPGSMGENGSFSGEPYYRFGDVVKDNDNCYWICVRPAYSPDSKEDTHWMSFQIGPKTVKEYTKSKCKKQRYPVDLGVQKEKMQYLAQLMAILANPERYKKVAGTAGNYFSNHGLGGLQEAAMPVDSLVVQAKLWEKYKVWEAIMPMGYDEFDEKIDANKFKARFSQDVSFIYEKGSTSGTKLNIPIVTYTGAVNFYKNEPTYATVAVNMQDVEFDVTYSYTSLGKRGSENYPVPDAFVVRYKTGKQLSSNWFFNPEPTEALPGVNEVFRFNSHKDEIELTNNDENTWNKNDFEGESYYHTCDVYKDENGHRWFVTRMAGSADEKAPYSELVSLEGLKTTDNNGRFTNVPTRNQVIRALLPLWFLCHTNYEVNNHQLESGSMNKSVILVRHLRDFANVDVRRLVQNVLGFEGSRAQTELFSIPYLDETTQQQKLLRVIEESANPRKDMVLWVWEHYPNIPSATEQWQKNFSNDYIYLQDVANENSVKKWAEDAYARQPLVDGGDGETKREPRKTTDSHAENVNNYVYNRNTWDNFSYYTDMWNAPLLCFRTTAVYDRGKKDHASVTVDGHQLTLEHGLTILEDARDETGLYDIMYQDLSVLWTTYGIQFLDPDSPSLYLDGKVFKYPTWQETWK